MLAVSKGGENVTNDLNIPYLLSFKGSLATLDNVPFYNSITEYIKKIPNTQIAINIAKAINSFLYYNSTEPNTLSDEEIKNAWDFFYTIVRNRAVRKNQLACVEKFSKYLIAETFSLTTICMSCESDQFPDINTSDFFKDMISINEEGLKPLNVEVMNYLNDCLTSKHFFVSFPVDMAQWTRDTRAPLKDLTQCFKDSRRDELVFNGFLEYYDYFIECLVLNQYKHTIGINLLDNPEYSPLFSEYCKNNYDYENNPMSLDNFVLKFLEAEKMPPTNCINLCTLNVHCFSNLFLRRETLNRKEQAYYKTLRDFCLEIVTNLLNLYGFYNETPLENLQTKR